MERIGRVSRGSKMDQVYLPKNRVGFGIGNYVVIKSLEEKKPVERLYFYGIKSIEPIKLEIIKEVIGIIGQALENYENIIVTGSFLDVGFSFNDIDIVIVAEGKIIIKEIGKDTERKTGIRTHILTLSNKALIKGLETDPLYQMMLSRCVAKKRFIYKTKHKIDYKLLDLHLLKSKTLINNFDILDGNKKYDLVRNMVAIYLYLRGKKISNELVSKEIKRVLNLKNINEIKQNVIGKKDFLKKYKLVYDKAFAKILRGIESGAE